jgi:putative flippase GtrA
VIGVDHRPILPPAGPAAANLRFRHAATVPYARAAMASLLRMPIILKLVKYSSASVAGVVVGQATLIFCLEAFEWEALAANLASVTLGAVPNYTINRYWTWQQSGKNRLWGEVIPFWVMSAAGALLSMLAVAFADHQWGTTVAVAIASLTGFGVLWVAKFLVLDKLMWRVVHDLHPEVEIDAAEAGLPGALDLDRSS